MARFAGSVDMGRLFGWQSWTVGHVVFGAVLGLWPVLRPADVGVEPRAQSLDRVAVIERHQAAA